MWHTDSVPINSDIIELTLTTPAGEAAFDVAGKMMDAGYECWWVGGAPRDMLLGRLPGDIDMATSATPEQVSALFPKSDTSAAALGSTVISYRGQRFELTTFRSDDDVSDGRRPATVSFGSRQQDAVRRDATVNALYWNPVTRELQDPCGGEKDLAARIVRFIGEPAVRIRQDALRILRLVRLKSLISGTFEPKTAAALTEAASHAGLLSGTRVLAELEKILRLPKPSEAMRDLQTMGILQHVLPELSACAGVAQPPEYHQEGDVFDHIMQCVDAFRDDHEADTRLAALFHDIGKVQTFSVQERIRFDHHAEASAKIVDAVFRRLQMPAARASKIRWIIEHHMIMGIFATLSDERKAHWYFHPWFRELLQVFAIDIAGTTPSDYGLYDSIIADYDEFLNAHPRPEKPLLGGDEIMEILGVGPGAVVGKALAALHDAQIRKEVTTKAEAKAYLETQRKKLHEHGQNP